MNVYPYLELLDWLNMYKWVISLQKKYKWVIRKQQQQQHNLLSKASWGRLEMKPKRNKDERNTKRTQDRR